MEAVWSIIECVALSYFRLKKYWAKYKLNLSILYRSKIFLKTIFILQLKMHVKNKVHKY